MPVYKYKNVIIKSASSSAGQAVLICHGGHTPARNRLMTGSGEVMVPHGLNVGFNTTEDNFSIGPRVLHFLQGYDYAPVEMVRGGEIIKNYSLSCDEKYAGLNPTLDKDVITISDKGKAHMSDVYEAIRIHSLMYTTLYSFACRVNKLTYTGSIQVKR